MFPDAQDFVIEGSTFTDVKDQYLNHSTHYRVNLSLPVESIQFPSVESSDYLLDPENLESLFSQVKIFMAAATNVVNASTSGSSEDPRLSSVASTLTNGSIVNEADERPVTISEPERPIRVFQEVERRLTIYTGVDKALKKLKRSINIALTLTPATTHESSAPWATLVWKVLHFEKTATMQHQIHWTSRTGFCRVEELDDGTLQPGDLRSIVEPGDATILQTIEGDDEFAQRMRIPFKADEMRAVCNMTGFEQRMALCSIEPKGPESNQFSPVVDLAVGEFFACGPPEMLQAFVVPRSEYKEREPIDTRTLLRPLFISDSTSAPEPINISRLSKPVTTFRLYSNTLGRIVLEKSD